jgi:hypothetical protein
MTYRGKGRLALLLPVWLLGLGHSLSAQQLNLNFTTFVVPGADQTVAKSINASGAITGWYDVNILNGPSAHGFLRTPDGAITTFATNSFLTRPTQINASSVIIGQTGLNGRGAPSCVLPTALPMAPS